MYAKGHTPNVFGARPSKKQKICCHRRHNYRIAYDVDYRWPQRPPKSTVTSHYYFTVDKNSSVNSSMPARNKFSASSDNVFVDCKISTYFGFFVAKYSRKPIKNERTGVRGIRTLGIKFIHSISNRTLSATQTLLHILLGHIKA